MNSLGNRLMAEAALLPAGTPLSAKRFLHLGERAAVDQALSRLARSGHLQRAARGLYLRPVETRFGLGAPGLEATLKALEHESGEVIVPAGAAAANRLGLTTQVPVRSVYLTSGRSRQLALGAQVIELRHAPRWQLVLPGRPAGEAVRALAWLGRQQGAKIAPRLARTLGPEGVQELSAARGRLPTWLAKEVSHMVAARA
ncbi:MAG: hypothetical protein IT180_06580 [Acidobacteria bacterium]|nr:hypothetical protein [Acidobacteriota bacterium]